jgi:hypothetical protein
LGKLCGDKPLRKRSTFGFRNDLAARISGASALMLAKREQAAWILSEED